MDTPVGRDSKSVLIKPINHQILACNNHGEAMPEGGQVSAHVKAGDTIQANWGQVFLSVPFNCDEALGSLVRLDSGYIRLDLS